MLRKESPKYVKISKGKKKLRTELVGVSLRIEANQLMQCISQIIISKVAAVAVV